MINKFDMSPSVYIQPDYFAIDSAGIRQYMRPSYQMQATPIDTTSPQVLLKYLMSEHSDLNNVKDHVIDVVLRLQSACNDAYDVLTSVYVNAEEEDDERKVLAVTKKLEKLIG